MRIACRSPRTCTGDRRGQEVNDAALRSIKRSVASRRSEGTHLERFLSRVYELVPLQLRALDEGFAALGADVHARPVGVQMLPHRRVVPEHLGASLKKKKNKEISHLRHVTSTND